MGVADRILRTILAIVVGVLVVTKVISGLLAIILGIVAVIFLVTAILGFCPLYILLGVSSKPKTADTKLPPRT
jgi:hypothetical protein